MKKSFALFLTLFSFTALFAQPANDDCSGIVDLGVAPICPVLDTFDNVGATQSVVFSSPLDNLPSCFTGGIVDRDVWFQFTVPPDGSIVDFTVEVTGITGGPNGTMQQPQVAVYRGDCSLDELAELYCATSALGEDFVEVDLIGMTPGLPIYLRISDWSASASPNWGDFVLCVKEYEPVFNMGDAAGASVCAGTLYDSGGPTGDYANNENFTFTVCPQDFTQCLFIDVQSFATETNFDELTFFIGDDTNDPMLSNFSGTGGNVQLQVYGQCVTFQFTSDGSAVDSGFELTWQCSPDTCTVPPPSTCDNPTVIANLPYTNLDMTTCNAANAVSTSPCANDGWLNGEDVIFTYTSPGDECIAVNLTGTNNGTGVGIFDACPNLATQCIAVDGGGTGEANPSINGVFLENPGTYYIVVDNATSCTPFNIEVTEVTCPVVLPSAAFCDDALSLNGCGELPAIVSVAPGVGDASFLVDGVNDGCWGFFNPPNFTFFLFQAQEDGNFGFVMQAADPDEASDIDFQVWGPVTSLEEICDYAENNQPTRSSYAAGPDATGLADVHPTTGLAVTDVCETAVGDDFVSTIPVQQGEYYLVLINDFAGVIQSGAISIDFGNTTTGVLDEGTLSFMVTQDTAICPGEAAQLLATGGEAYQWFPSTGLSCEYCPNPIATVSQSTVYNVSINSVCNTDTLEVEVGLLQVNAGPDLTVCLNEEVQIVAGASFNDIDYAWTGPAGFLSCNDCPNPLVTATQAGTFTFTVTVTGPSCSFSDQMTLTVLAAGAPSYQISPNQSICVGDAVNLGGAATQGVSYVWSSEPTGFSSTASNPSVTPSTTTTYYLLATNTACPLPSFDSVTVVVSNLPIIDAISSTTICQGESILMGNTVPEPGVTYNWTPGTGLSDANIANPTATPNQTTSYTLTATRFGCAVQETVNISVTPIEVNILSSDTIPICKGVSVPISATSSPSSTVITWTPNNNTLNTTTGPNVIATPSTATSYIASASNLGCTRFDTVYIGVDSLPWDMDIMPADTMICLGETVLLTSPVYEPGDFGQIEFLWTPGDGQLTPDSFYNMVAQPLQTTTYFRTAANGFCTSVDSATITVIPVVLISIEPALDTICPGEAVNLVVIGPAELTEFSWDPANDLSCTDCPNPTATPGATITYNVQAAFEGCPVGASTTLFVPSGPVFDLTDQFSCPGAPVILNSVNNPQATYVWTASDGSDVPDIATPTVNPTQATTYTVTATIGDCVSTDQLTVTIATDFTVTVATPPTVCPGSSATLNAVIVPSGPNYEYTWRDENGNIVGNTASITETPDVATTYTVDVTDVNNCFNNSATVFVDVSLAFTVDAGADTVVQAGAPVTLIGTATKPGVDFQWTDNDGEVLDGSEVTVTNCEENTYTLKGTDAAGCMDIDSVTIFVNQAFRIDSVVAVEATLNDSIIYEGEAFVLIAYTTPSNIPGATYNWYIGDDLVSTTNDTVSEVLNAQELFGLDDVRFEDVPVRLEIVSEAGCSAEKDGNARVNNIPIGIPNAFSPNGDQMNDSFLVVSRIPLTIVEFNIWNRWGQLVYENENGPDGWDGKQKDEEAPSDVYIYRVIYQVTGGSGRQYTKKGDVTLLR